MYLKNFRVTLAFYEIAIKSLINFILLQTAHKHVKKYYVCSLFTSSIFSSNDKFTCCLFLVAHLFSYLSRLKYLSSTKVNDRLAG